MNAQVEQSSTNYLLCMILTTADKRGSPNYLSFRESLFFRWTAPATTDLTTYCAGLRGSSVWCLKRRCVMAGRGALQTSVGVVMSIRCFTVQMEVDVSPQNKLVSLSAATTYIFNIFHKLLKCFLCRPTFLVKM